MIYPYSVYWSDGAHGFVAESIQKGLFGHGSTVDAAVCDLEKKEADKFGYGRRPMMVSEYQRDVLRTARKDAEDDIDFLVEGAMGLNGEAGEVIDIVKKTIYQDHDLDIRHIAEELGDVAWYLTIAAYGIGYDLEKVLRMNVEKLHKRYPEGFDRKRSVNRDDYDI